MKKVDKVSQPPPDHSVEQTWDLINIYNEIWKHYSSYLIYHYSSYIKIIPGINIYEEGGQGFPAAP